MTSPAPGSRALESQAKANRSTRDHWSWFSTHRAEVQKLVLPDLLPAGAPARLCVLGAGNCNDIDLKVLASTFAEVHLVDIDRAAIKQAVVRQEVAADSRIRLHGGVDLTAIADVFQVWEKRPPTAAEVEDAAVRVAGAAAPTLGGPFDVVLSPCLLSQLVGYATDVLGRDHSRRHRLLVALRTLHLRTIVDLLSPGGAGIIVCDVASSTGRPELLDTRREKLSELLDRLTYTDRGFEGIGPNAMQEALRRDPLIAPLLGPVQQVAPWRWHLGPRRTFLVYALRFRRRPGPVVLKA